jgi:hypothetical protein
MSRTNDFSIFKVSKGSRLKYSKEEKPVPKSSIASLIPLFLSLPSDLITCSVLVTSELSVSSSSRHSGWSRVS